MNKSRNTVNHKEIVNKIKDLQYKIRQCILEDNISDYSNYLKELQYWRNKQVILKKKRRKHPEAKY